MNRVQCLLAKCGLIRGLLLHNLWLAFLFRLFLFTACKLVQMICILVECVQETCLFLWLLRLVLFWFWFGSSHCHAGSLDSYEASSARNCRGAATHPKGRRLDAVDSTLVHHPLACEAREAHTP